MIVVRVFFITWFSAFILSSSAQDAPPLNATWKDSASFFIRQLKEGALAIRLHTRAEAISQLRQAGNNLKANDIESIQKEENKEIVKAFRTQFKFCKVYFFYSESTEDLLKGKTDGLFLNDSLQKDPSVSMHEKFFMIAEKGNPAIPHKHDPTSSSAAEKDERSYLNETIIILDRNLKQLKPPFPHYAQETFPTSMLVTDWDAKVRSLNGKLYSFYKKSAY